MTKTDETITVGTRITKSMYNELIRLLKKNPHLNMADYLRDLIRKELERAKGV